MSAQISPVTDAMVERAWAAIVGRDIAPQCFNASIIRGDLRTALEAVIGPAQAWRIPTPDQIEPILDDFLGVDSPHYEELRRRCAQRIFEVCVVTSGIPVTPSDNKIAPLVPSTDRGDK